MPFRNYQQFDTKTIRAMTIAYDVALRRLAIDGNHPVSGRIAARIAICADGGVRNPAKLCRDALDQIEPAIARARPRSADRKGA